ncbi:hypothetical protein GOODEAATRI_029811, partial [Goodea atripinnis]
LDIRATPKRPLPKISGLFFELISEKELRHVHLFTDIKLPAILIVSVFLDLNSTENCDTMAGTFQGNCLCGVLGAGMFMAGCAFLLIAAFPVGQIALGK